MALKKRAPKVVKAKRKAAGENQPLAAVSVRGIDGIVKDAFVQYGTETIQDRALPDFRDGLTPVQRRVIYAAFEEGLLPDRAHRKAAHLVGTVMSRTHPHGDMSIYKAMVGLAHKDMKIIDGMGNWGRPELGSSVPAAAMRYIEARLTKEAVQVFFNKRYMDVADLIPNYDGSRKEPLILPALLPMPLVIGARGIAVGTTTFIPSFTLDSVIALTKKMLESKKGMTAPEMGQILKLASQYGGTAVSKPAAIRKVIGDGQGAVDWVCDFTHNVKAKTTIITGLCPDWSYDGALARMRKLPEIRHVQDYSSGANGIKIEIAYRTGLKAADVEKAQAKIEKFLTRRLTYRFNVTHRFVTETDGIVESSAKFKSVNLAELMNDWIKWRLALEVKAATKVANDLTFAIRRENLLLLATKHLDALIKIIRSNKGDASARIKAIMKLLTATEEEAKYVLTIPIGRFDRVSEGEQKAKILKLTSELKQAQKDVKDPRSAALRFMPDYAAVKKKAAATRPKRSVKTRQTA
jgi:DNA gyrase subunit A